jgi:hypothetical protein
MITSLGHPKDRVVVIATLPDPLTKEDLVGYADHVVLCNFTEHYIGKWWNVGLDYVRDHAQLEHEALVISSDYVGTKYSVAALGAALRQKNLTMVGPNLYTDQLKCMGLHDRCTVFDRVLGACWMLAGESGLRVDEQFRWWYTDNDIDWQARHCKGIGLVPHTGLIPEPDSALNEEKGRWAQEDLIKFEAKWGHKPFW